MCVRYVPSDYACIVRNSSCLQKRSFDESYLIVLLTKSYTYSSGWAALRVRGRLAEILALGFGRFFGLPTELGVAFGFLMPLGGVHMGFDFAMKELQAILKFK